MDDPSSAPIAAPDIAQQLHGLALSEAFQRFVLDDPEVKRLGQAAIAADDGARSVFERGGFEVMGGAWPVRMEDWDVGDRIVNPFIMLGGGERPVAAPIREAGDVIKARVLALVQLFRDGKIQARQEKRGGWLYVERWRWDRTETRVHFMHGDLYDFNEDKGKTPIYRSLQIVDAAQVSAGQETSSAEMRGSAGAPAQYPWGEVLMWLIPEFEKNGLPPTVNALKNMVQLHLSSLGYDGPADSTVKDWLKRSMPDTLQKINDRRNQRG